MNEIRVSECPVIHQREIYTYTSTAHMGHRSKYQIYTADEALTSLTSSSVYNP